MSNKKFGVTMFLLYSLFFGVLSRFMGYFNFGPVYEFIGYFGLTVLWAFSVYMLIKRYIIINRPDLMGGEINFHTIEDMKVRDVQNVLVVANFNGKWIFIRYKESDGWELPSGKCHADEEISKTAEGILIEKIGAKTFILSPVCMYSIARKNGVSYGALFYSEITEFWDILDTETIEVKGFDEMPDILTYPLIHAELFRKIKESGEHNGNKK